MSGQFTTLCWVRLGLVGCVAGPPFGARRRTDEDRSKKHLHTTGPMCVRRRVRAYVRQSGTKVQIRRPALARPGRIAAPPGPGTQSGPARPRNFAWLDGSEIPRWAEMGRTDGPMGWAGLHGPGRATLMYVRHMGIIIYSIYRCRLIIKTSKYVCMQQVSMMMRRLWHHRN